jgi:Arabinose-binding domain of AraC transcription regulator, N-term
VCAGGLALRGTVGAGGPHHAAVAQLGEIALEVTGDDNFGLHLAMDVRDVGNFDAGALLLMTSPTVRVALERMVAHQRYWGEGDRATLLAGRGGVTIRYVLKGAEGGRRDPRGSVVARLRRHHGLPPRLPTLDRLEPAPARRFGQERVIRRAEVMIFGATSQSRGHFRGPMAHAV